MEETKERSPKGEVLVRVRCSCGYERLLIKGLFTKGKAKCCRACSMRQKGIRQTGEVRVPDAPLNSVLQTYKHHAARRGFEFSIPDSEFKELTQQACYYCGEPPSQLKRRNRRSTLYNGVDRYDNTKGYTKENCVACCKTCNTIKMKHSVPFLIEHMQKMLAHLAGKHD